MRLQENILAYSPSNTTLESGTMEQMRQYTQHKQQSVKYLAYLQIVKVTI